MNKKKKFKINPIFEFDTKLTADCIDFLSPYCLCGTYQLNEKEKERNGKFYIFKQEEERIMINKEPIMEKEINGGIFDMKWYGNGNEYQFAIADSKGFVSVYKIKEEGKLIELIVVDKYKLESMCLYVSWNNKKYNSPKMCVSNSNGNVSILCMNKSEIKCLNTVKGHEYEAWCVCFNEFNDNVVYSGADDSLFKVWDVRSNKLFIKNTIKEHNAGVCCIQSSPFKENIIATGSYDENVRIWDLRNSKSPIKEFECGGGVWRIKWNKMNENLLLTACMGNGFKILNIDLTENNLPKGILCSYHETDKLAYGIDWISYKEDKYCICSCSFYDHQMQFWEVNVE